MSYHPYHIMPHVCISSNIDSHDIMQNVFGPRGPQNAAPEKLAVFDERVANFFENEHIS